MEEALFSLKERMTENEKGDKLTRLVTNTREKVAHMIAIFLDEYEKREDKQDLYVNIMEKDHVTFALIGIATSETVLQVVITMTKAGEDVVPMVRVTGKESENLQDYPLTKQYLDKLINLERE